MKDGRTVYEHICSLENIYGAIHDAAKDHAKDPRVQEMKANPVWYALEAQWILVTEEFRYGRFETRDIIERGKKRHLLFTHSLTDRIIQHAVMRVIRPILERTYTKDTYAAQEGRGTHLCSDNIQRSIQEDPENHRFFCQVDIRHYFDNIPRDLLFRFLEKKIKDKPTLKILHRLIFGVPGRKGLGVGLYISQILSTFFLSAFDHWVREHLRAPDYYRYMDDMVFFAPDKHSLHRMLAAVKRKLRSYGLKLKSNWRIAPIATGLNIVGYVHYPTHKLLRKKVKISYIRVCNAIFKRLRTGRAVTEHLMHSMRSYDGQASHCCAKHLRSLNEGHVLDVLDPEPRVFTQESYAASHLLPIRACA